MEDTINQILQNKAAQAFNQCWDIIDKTDKTDEDFLKLIEKAHESYSFWLSVKSHTPKNISIAFWMLSRAYVLANESNMALIYAKRCIDVSDSEQVDSFYLAYGYEALARTYFLTNDKQKSKEAIEKARETVKTTQEKDISWFLNDLKEIEDQL